MIALLGRAFVALGLAAAGLLVVQAVRAQLRPASVGRDQLRPAVVCLLIGAAGAMLTLEKALLSNDFSIAYVAANHARATPLLFTITSAWSALEGSIVLWGLVLAGYTATVFASLGKGKAEPDRLGTGALAVLGMVAVFFFGLLATVANPFRTLPVVPSDGPGPNPLLQNHILVAFHPPLLYLGFVGFTVPFAFAIAALVHGEGGAEWLRRTRRWSLLAWSFLTLGLVLGGWWSYAVLGWGGFWAWDPVENAALLPWLLGTAFIHSAVVQTRRGRLQAWNFALVIGTFALTILGTFLTRSGVIASVHSFTQSAIGPLLLGFLVVVLAGSFGLLGLRGHLIASPTRLESLASREGAFLVNNLLLALFAFTVLVGTLYPIFVEAFSGAQVSVGRPFFDRMAVPISLGLLLVMGVGPILPYRAARPAIVWRRVHLPVRVGYVVGVVMLATAIVGVIVRQLAATVWSLPSRQPAAVLRALGRNRGYWGGQLAHVGVVLVAVAIAVTGNLATRTTVTLTRGQPATFGPYQVALQGLFARQEPSRQVTGARIELRRGSRVVRVLEPRLSQYPTQVQAIGTPAVWTGPTQDVYASLTQLDAASGTVSLNLYRYPFMWLLWLGGVIAAAGGAVALGRRQRPTIRTVLPAAQDEDERTAGKAGQEEAAGAGV